MSTTERCSFSYRYIKLASLNYENDEDSEVDYDENELTDSDSVTNIYYENFKSYVDDEEDENEEVQQYETRRRR